MGGSPTRNIRNDHIALTIFDQPLQMRRDLFRKFLRRDKHQSPRSLPSLIASPKILQTTQHTSQTHLTGGFDPGGNVPTALAFKIFCTTGIQYAAVFPLPVRARARTSRFSSARGMAFCWTRVGRAKPRSARARRRRGEIMWEKAANVCGDDEDEEDAMVRGVESSTASTWSVANACSEKTWRKSRGNALPHSPPLKINCKFDLFFNTLSLSLGNSFLYLFCSWICSTL